MPQKLLEKHRELLRAIPLFEGLTEQDLAKVSALAQIRSYPARAVVVTQGEPAAALYAIVTGRLKVTTSDPEGRDTVLGIMGEREVFGEVALIDGGARSATCIAVEPCNLLVLDRALFLELLGNSPEHRRQVAVCACPAPPPPEPTQRRRRFSRRAKPARPQPLGSRNPLRRARTPTAAWHQHHAQALSARAR